MPPLVSLAISLVPDLARRVAGRVLPGVGDKVEETLVRTVTEVLGTDDAAEAERMIQDPKIAAELRVKLAEIEVQAAKVEAEERERARRAELETLKAEIDAHKAEMADTQDARQLLEGLSEKDSIFAWGPVIVSTIVVGGFFLVLYQLISGDITIDTTNQGLWQIVNIAVGALTAGFATVISFWLGSSQGSRKKDSNAAIAQKAQTVLEANRQQAAARDSAATSSLLSQLGVAGFAAAPAEGKPAAATAGKPPRHFHTCMNILLRHEGGFVNDPNDKGGATNMGITHKTLARWLEKPSVTVEEVRDLDPDTAREIYRNWFWNALNCDQLPLGVDLVTFDFGVNAGPSRSARVLQDVLAVKADGQVGPVTIGAARQADPRDLITRFSDARLKYYQGLDDFQHFGRGWTRRTTDVRDAALALLDT